MEKLVVLDYANSSFNIYTVKSSDIDNLEQFLNSLGHRLDDCAVMQGNKITINIEL